MISDINLLGNSQGIVYLDPKIPDGALDLSVTKKQLYSPPGGYVGSGLQMQTDLAVDPTGNVWVMNNWQDIDSCFGVPDEVGASGAAAYGAFVSTTMSSV